MQVLRAVLQGIHDILRKLAFILISELVFETCPCIHCDAAELDLSGIPMNSVDTLEAGLKYFNNLQKVVMCDTGLPSEEIDALWKRHPETRFVWNVQIGRFWIRTDATTLMPFQYGYNGTKGIRLYDKDCTEMKYLVDMVCMDFGHMGIQDVSFLAYMPNLEYLIIADAPVPDISAMANLKKLKYLEAFLCHILDISPLLGCTSLEDLNLGSDAELLEDYRGRSLLVFSSYWAIDFTCRRNPGLKVKEIIVEEG